MSNGFGTINTRNINEIVASLAKQIKDIKTDFAKDYTVLNNKLEKCEEVLQDLKDYIETVEENIEWQPQPMTKWVNEKWEFTYRTTITTDDTDAWMNGTLTP